MRTDEMMTEHYDTSLLFPRYSVEWGIIDTDLFSSRFDLDEDEVVSAIGHDVELPPSAPPILREYVVSGPFKELDDESLPQQSKCAGRFVLSLFTARPALSEVPPGEGEFPNTL